MKVLLQRISVSCGPELCPGMAAFGTFGRDPMWTSCLLRRRHQARHGHLAVSQVVVDAFGGQTLAGSI